MRRFLAFIWGWGLASGALAASLPTGLTEPELDRVLSVAGGGALTRLMRSAETYEEWPGVKVGLEIPLIPTLDIKDLGARDGSVPSLIPTPRLYLAKGLPWESELIFQFYPASWSHAIATVGFLVKTSLQTEPEDWFALSVFGGYSRFVGFSDQLTGGGLEAGFVASKDYVRIRPYLGTGFVLLHGSFSPTISPAPDLNRVRPTAHVFAGCEIEMPVNVAFQFDLLNWLPSGSFFVGVKF